MSDYAMYKCTMCGYIYREEKGEPRLEIAPGTRFDDLPDDFKCPTCNQPKMAFELRKL